MRSVLAFGLSIMLLAPANAATMHRAKSRANPPAQTHIIARPDPGATPPVRFSVPGWSDEQTRRWLDNATSCEYCG